MAGTPTEMQQRIDGFMDAMMASVTDCDYNKSLLYEMAKSSDARADAVLP